MPLAHRSWAAAPTPRRIAYIVGAVLVAGGAAALPAAAVGFVYGEWETSVDLLVMAALMLITGGVTMLIVGKPDALRPKDAFAGVATAWIAVIAFGSLPYVFSGTLGAIDALFESTSGFTTTGATVIDDLSTISHGLLFWRATTQWLGGMGIIVLSIAVLPLVGAGSILLARAETPGPDPDRLTPRMRGTALRLWGLYFALTLLVGLLLAFGDMTIFEAAAHSLTTVSTGGFSTESGSVGHYSAYTQWVIIGFMVIAAASFSLHIRALRDPKEYLEKAEFRYYLAGLVIGTVALLGGIAMDAGGVPIREVIFTAIAMTTGTGYAVTDFALWPASLLAVILLMMFAGGMGGSTTGALKTYRVVIILKSAAAEVRRLTRPRTISVTRFGKGRVPPEIIGAVRSYVVVYMVAFVLGMILLLYAESLWGTEMDLVTGISAAASAIGNVGPGLGDVGPAGSYAALTAPGKLVLGALMILGRLEIYPAILLLTVSFWRR
ncbi:MAG: TrkH family potassium uptake protein [Actinomycetota bacterium]